MTTDAELTGDTVPDKMPPRYTMRFERWTGITARTDEGAVYLEFPTWRALRALVAEGLGALLDLSVIPHDVSARIIRRFDEKYPEGS